jgi:hypothetical protein
MQTELIVATVSAVVALSSAVIAIRGQLKTARLSADLERAAKIEERRLESEKAVSKYREPLARAAYDLQSRLYNILEGKLIERYLVNGDKREQSYIVNNTVFVIAQYCAWTEIVRREIQYIDLGNDQETQRLARLQDTMYSLWQTDTKFEKKLLRLWAGEQRALGESLIAEGPRGPECIGYGKFLRKLKSQDPLCPLGALQSEIKEMGELTAEERPRFVALQNSLIDLLAFLDPNNIRFPADRRSKVER